MPAKITHYKISDFLRLTESGELDYARSKKLIHELAEAAALHPDNNILMDLRETTVSVRYLAEIFDIVFELGRFRKLFSHRIANIVPDDPERLKIAEKFKDAMVGQGFDYNFFTSYEAAIDWLSDVSSLNPKKNGKE